ncbi:MAG: Uma2 family endonuclease [Bryobacterales bacterium]|nr:Uma2 family endonuclease [Bryobacterales bacterium]
MSSTVLMPVEEYLHLSEKPTCEYREGVLYPKAMATTFHGLLQFMLMMMLHRLGLQTASEVTVRLSPTKYLVPDVVAAPVLQNPYPTEPVLLCCEILSPEDRLGTMLAKCEEYHAWGVPYCWVIDPVKRTAWEYHAGAEPVRASGALRAGEYAAGLDELFSAIDAKA